MADRFELVAIALSVGYAPEALPPAVVAFVGACWSGMSRAQLLERARRVGLHVSLRRLNDSAVDDVQRHTLRLTAMIGQNGPKGGDASVELVAHVRRVVRRRGARRAKVSLSLAMDTRQGGLF